MKIKDTDKHQNHFLKVGRFIVFELLSPSYGHGRTVQKLDSNLDS